MIEGSRVRVSIVGVVVLALFCALFARLWYLQIAGGTNLAAAANANRVRIVSDPALRGRILDAKGRVLADNRVANVVTVDRRLDPEAAQAGRGRARAAARHDGRGDRQAARRHAGVAVHAGAGRRSTCRSTRSRTSASTRPTSRACRPSHSPVRRYPLGSLGAHVLGYMGEINEGELAAEPKGDATSSATRSGSRAWSRPTSRTCAGRRARSGSRSTCRAGCSRRSSTTKPSPATTCSSRSTSTCRTSRSGARRGDGRRAADPEHGDQGHASRTTTRRRVRSWCSTRRRDRSSRWRRTRRTTPTSSPTGSRTATYRRLNDPANHYPLLNRAIRASTPRDRRSSSSRRSPGSATGEISPGHDRRRQRCIDLKVEGGKFCNAGNEAPRLRRPARGAHRVERRVLLRDRRRRSGAASTATSRHGNAIQDEAADARLRCADRHRRSRVRRRAGCPTRRGRRRSHDRATRRVPEPDLAPGRQHQPRGGPGRPARDPAAARVGLRRRSPTAAPCFTPTARVAGRSTTTARPSSAIAPTPQGERPAARRRGASAILCRPARAVPRRQGHRRARCSPTSRSTRFDSPARPVLRRSSTSRTRRCSSASPSPTPARPAQYVVVAIVEEGGFGADDRRADRAHGRSRSSTACPLTPIVAVAEGDRLTATICSASSARPASMVLSDRRARLALDAAAPPRRRAASARRSRIAGLGLRDDLLRHEGATHERGREPAVLREPPG